MSGSPSFTALLCAARCGAGFGGTYAMLCAAWLCSLCSACWLEARRGEARARWRRAGALGCRRWLSYWLSYWLWLSFRCWVSALALALALALAPTLVPALVPALVSVLDIGSRTASRIGPGIGSGIASRTTRAASGAVVSDKRTGRAGPERRFPSLAVPRRHCAASLVLAIVLVTPQGARLSLAPLFLLGRVSWGRRRRCRCCRRCRRCRCCRRCCLVVSGCGAVRSEAAKRSAGP